MARLLAFSFPAPGVQLVVAPFGRAHPGGARRVTAAGAGAPRHLLAGRDLVSADLAATGVTP